MKKFQYAGNSISHVLVPYLKLKRWCGTTKYIGTSSPSAIASLIVSGGIPNCTVPRGVTT
eukprot:246779-Prymnesium_polylepis.1